jgi:hypothetical protein
MAKGYDVCTTTIIGWPSMTCLTSIFVACVVTATFTARPDGRISAPPPLGGLT